MALIIEDGSIVIGANSYATLAEARAYALARGITLSDDDAVLSPMMISAMDYLESFRDRYKGMKVTGLQYLQWPRQNAYIDGIIIPTNAVPPILKAAHCQAAMEIFNGSDLMPTSSGFATSSEKVDVIEVQYAAGSSTGATDPEPNFPKVLALLSPLFRAFGMLYAVRA